MQKGRSGLMNVEEVLRIAYGNKKNLLQFLNRLSFIVAHDQFGSNCLCTQTSPKGPKKEKNRHPLFNLN
jgi:hypothetical protein